MNVDARVASSENYIKKANYRLALNVLGKSELPQMQVQRARILNMLGASNSAMKILHALSAEELAQHRSMAGGIFLSNYHYMDAYALQKDIKLSSESTYADRRELISKAEVLQGIGKTEEAIVLVDEILAVSEEPLLRGILFQIKGAYQLLDGRVAAAGETLLESERNFKLADPSIDRGYLDKWLGAYFIFKDDFPQAKKYLNRAWKILYRPGLKPESWLEVLYWKGRLSLLQKKAFPEEWLRIRAYDQSENSRPLKWINSELLLPQSMIFGEQKTLNTPRERHLDLQARHDLPHTEELIAKLILAGKFGIPLFRVAEVLWPDDPFSFDKNIKKIEKLIAHAKKVKKFKIKMQKLHLFSNQNLKWSCYWSAIK